MKNALVKVIVGGWLLCAAAFASAFTPAGGLWGFTNELNGQPGRGFQLTVENDVLVFYYYGYDSDGSGNYMFASGPLTGGSVFGGQLLVCSGGTVMGSAYKPATCSNGPGRVTMTFSSGEKGTIILPGEAPKPISRFNFGYADGPDGILGEYLFAYKGVTTSFSDFYTLTKKTDRKGNYGSGTGTGIVLDAADTFACEFVSGGLEYRDAYICTELSGNVYDDIYIFRMVGDRGTGVGTWYSASSVYPLQVVRVATSKQTRTGPYDENEEQLLKPRSLSAENREPAQDMSVQAKALEPDDTGTVPLLSKEEQAYFVDRAAALRAAARSEKSSK